MGRGRASQRGRLDSGRQDVFSVVRKLRDEANYVGERQVPLRGNPDIHGVTFDGFNRRILAANTLTEAEQATNSTDSRVLASHASDDTQRAVSMEHIKDNAVGPRILADYADDADDALRPVTQNSIRIGAVVTSKLASAAVTLGKIADSATNPGQGVGGLRTIGNALGGDSFAASAANHSHGSGNSHDIDLLPVAHQRRILLARSRVRNNIRQIPNLTREQLNAYLRELSICALAAVSLEIDGVDLTADERLAKRDAGEDVPLFSEWRLKAGQALHDPNHPRYLEGQPDVGTVPE